MNLIAKLITSLIIAIVASTLYSLLREGSLLDPLQLAAFFFTAAATALVVASGGSTSSDSGPVAAGQTKAARQPAASGAAREHGKVKWFNASKGFGFITKDDGEEIFVHFRSIRGEGRRGLRDGQEVTFVVAESDKGPQAEDVEGLA